MRGNERELNMPTENETALLQMLQQMHQSMQNLPTALNQAVRQGIREEIQPAPKAEAAPTEPVDLESLSRADYMRAILDAVERTKLQPLIDSISRLEGQKNTDALRQQWEVVKAEDQELFTALGPAMQQLVKQDANLMNYPNELMARARKLTPEAVERLNTSRAEKAAAEKAETDRQQRIEMQNFYGLTPDSTASSEPGAEDRIGRSSPEEAAQEAFQTAFENVPQDVYQ